MRAADHSGPAVFDRDVLSLDIAGFAQSLVKRGYHGFGLPDALEGLSQPITGIAFCCAWRIRAVVMAAPTSSSTRGAPFDDLFGEEVDRPSSWSSHPAPPRGACSSSDGTLGAV
jgi:hypothetical protein